MMESIFSFLPAYFSIIFLAKGKISKFMFLSHIGPKNFLANWPISLQDFKSNIHILFIWFILFISRDISLEQSDGIVYLFACWYQKLRVYREILGWMWSKMVVATLVTRWMDEWMGELSWFFASWCKFRKAKNYFNNFWVIVAKNGHETLISEWMDESGWFFAT